MSNDGGSARQDGRIARSWRLSATAWSLVRSDRTILTLAVVSTIAGAGAIAIIYDLAGVFSATRHEREARIALVTLAASLPLTFVSVYFNTAIAAAANALLDGRRLSLRQALAVPTRRLGQVALWSLLASVVGIIIEQIASRLPLVGSIAVRLLGLSWSLASMFAVPILAIDGCTATACLSRSARLVKQRWGEGVSGNVIITAWAGVAIFALAFVCGIGVAAARGDATARAAAIVVVVVLAVLVAAAAAVVRQTFAVVLYRYAASGSASGGFGASDLQAPFGGGLLGRPGASAQPRRAPSGSSLLRWAAAAIVAAALVTLLELHKRHYAAHHFFGRAFAAVLIWLVLTAALRLMQMGLARLRRRSDR
jgi:hypothetical protein